MMWMVDIKMKTFIVAAPKILLSRASKRWRRRVLFENDLMSKLLKYLLHHRKKALSFIASLHNFDYVMEW